MLLDHATVYALLNIKKTRTQRCKMSIRKISAITDEALCQEFNDDISLEGNLDELISNLNSELQRVTDTLVPVKEVTARTHKTALV